MLTYITRGLYLLRDNFILAKLLIQRFFEESPCCNFSVHNYTAWLRIIFLNQNESSINSLNSSLTKFVSIKNLKKIFPSSSPLKQQVVATYHVKYIQTFLKNKVFGGKKGSVRDGVSDNVKL